MEGIAGIVYPDVFQVNHFTDIMLDTMRHRSNGMQESLLFKNIQIGIIGGKLAYNRDRSICIALSGTVYNSEEIQNEIRKHGNAIHRERSQAELFIQAYELWGSNFIERMKGDFALAILDQVKERLLLARDRIGIKPLYWYHDQNYFIFASELKSLIATGCVPQTPALDAIASYLYFGYIPQDMTPIKNVNKLLPGYYLQYNRDKSLVIHPYWSYSSFFVKEVTSNQHTIIQHIDELLINSVKERLPQNESVGCFISGGLGSACIADYVTRFNKGNRIYSYMSVYKGQNESDMQVATEVARILGISHEIEWITPSNVLNNLVEIAWHLDEPLADPNVIAIWKMSAKAAEKTRRVVSGMGSDELMAGHSRYSLQERKANFSSWAWQEGVSHFGKLLIPLLNGIYPPSAYLLLKKGRTKPWQFDYLKQNSVFDESTMNEASPKLAKLFDPEVFLHKFHNLSRVRSKVHSFLYLDVKTRLTDCFILQFERLMSANKLDWSPPFLDQHLLEYLAGVPEPDDMTESQTATYLKALLKNVFPADFLNRPKRTRRDFLKSWVHQSELSNIFPLLTKGTLVETGIISQAWLEIILETPKSRENNFHLLWSLLMLEIWFRLYINNPIQTSPPHLSVKELLLET